MCVRVVFATWRFKRFKPEEKKQQHGPRLRGVRGELAAVPLRQVQRAPGTQRGHHLQGKSHQRRRSFLRLTLSMQNFQGTSGKAYLFDEA
jgi:hypothetical protein